MVTNVQQKGESLLEISGAIVQISRINTRGYLTIMIPASSDDGFLHRHNKYLSTSCLTQILK